MANLTTGNLIQSVSPARYQNSVATNSSIQVGFLRDMDRSTFSQSTIALEIVGTVSRIPITFSYSNRTLTITPSVNLSPNTSYKLTLVGDVNPSLDISTTNITGIRDIAGNGMIGEWTTIFTTGSTGTPGQVVVTSPTDESAILTQPTLQWNAVPGASAYQVQVSKDNTFENIYWPTPTSSWDDTQTSIQPDLPFAIDQEYWWRVRALAPGASGTSVPGPWSEVNNFYYGDPTSGTVTPDDAPLGVIPPTSTLVKIVSASPAPRTDNIQPSNFPTEIKVVISGPFDSSQFGPGTNNFWVEGEPIDGEFEGGDFKPIFTPSLNGSQFGAGGITVPAPVDAYQQIIVSGQMAAQPVVTDNGNGTSTITLPVPGGYLQDNNIYTVHFNMAELGSPVRWEFTTRWFPAFASARAVRRIVNHFLPELTDEEIWANIRKNSLNAIFLQVYPPTQVDGESWIYNPPISFNVNNPPFFVREYVRLQTSLDFLRDLLHQAIRGGKTQLGDFSVDQESAATRGMLELAVERVEKELAPFLDKLHGHTNRGYARGAAALRGEGSMRSNPLRELPFGLNKRGPNFNW